MEDYLLKIYNNKMVFTEPDNNKIVFHEGNMSEKTKKNQEKIIKKLENKYIENLVDNSETLNSNKWDELKLDHKQTIESLINTITAGAGRSLVALCFLQFCIKSICQDQDIRLHKGNRIKNKFSWVEGLPMRIIDKKYITPVLREYNLLKLNADGLFMTRSLAENYPYTPLYKADIKGGGKDNWIKLVDLLQHDEIDAKLGLEYMIAKLIYIRDGGKVLENKVVENCEQYCIKNPSLTMENSKEIILENIKDSSDSARLLEVAIHSLYQVLNEKKLLDGELRTLGQMRSADKKHKNIGDIEITNGENKKEIIEAWDAKYKKDYLYDELCELEEKLIGHESVITAGFITSTEPIIDDIISNKIETMSSKFNMTIEIISYSNFIKRIDEKYSVCGLGEKWIVSYTESLAQKRRNIAPIDEPSIEWLKSLNNIFIKDLTELI